MSQDKSQLQVVEQFSFIYTLTHSSNLRDRQSKHLEKKVSLDIHKSQNKLDRESCGKLVNFSWENSVTLSSVLGFPKFIGNNESALSLLNEPTSDRSFVSSHQAQLSGQQNQNNSAVTKHLGKIFLLLSSSYFIFIACWLAGHDYYGKIFPFSALRSILNFPESKVSTADLQFIDYLKRSLSNIELQQNSLLSDLNNKSENSEVVYVPVYNIDNNNSALSEYSLSSSDIDSPLPVPIIPPPPPNKIPLSNPTTSVHHNKSNESAKSKLPAIPQSSAVTENKISSSTDPSSVKSHTLIGIFELGKRSAALFKVDGVTKRIWVGDKLDNGGWILESVANQKAKISRQGETRSLSVGEKF